MVEDVVQGCFVKLWLSTVCFEDIKVITAYLYRAVYNAALNFVRASLFSADVIRKFFRFCRIFGLTQWTKTGRRMTETVRQWDGEESVKSK